MPTTWGFDNAENKRRRDCMKMLCTSLREHAKNTIDFKKKKMLRKSMLYLGKKSPKVYWIDKTYRTIRDDCHYTRKFMGAAHSICNLKFNVANKIVVFHNSSNYDYHFMIKELSNEFEGQFEYLGENKEKYKTCSVPTKEKLHNKVYWQRNIYDDFIIKSCW